MMEETNQCLMHRYGQGQWRHKCHLLRLLSRHHLVHNRRRHRHHSSSIQCTRKNNLMRWLKWRGSNKNSRNRHRHHNSQLWRHLHLHRYHLYRRHLVGQVDFAGSMVASEWFKNLGTHAAELAKRKGRRSTEECAKHTTITRSI